MNYTTIQKSEIPQTPTMRQDRYGEWMALCRTIRIAPADRAFVLQLGTLRLNTAVKSLHSAARRVGIKVSTTYLDGTLYIVRTGVCRPVSKPQYQFTCDNCRAEEKSSQPHQRWCWRKHCQEARIKKNNDAVIERRRNARLRAKS